MILFPSIQCIQQKPLTGDIMAKHTHAHTKHKEDRCSSLWLLLCENNEATIGIGKNYEISFVSESFTKSFFCINFICIERSNNNSTQKTPIISESSFNLYKMYLTVCLRRTSICITWMAEIFYLASILNATTHRLIRKNA